MFMSSTMLSFSPRQLFGAGEQGVWYDPADMSTLFQDSAGTTPVTAVEQPVGLMLDKSKGLVLGSELVSNGTFDTNITGWSLTNTTSGSVSWNANKLRIVRVGATTANQAVSVVAGTTYKIVADITIVSGSGTTGQLGIRAAADYGVNLANVVLSASGTATMFYTAASTTTVYLHLIAGFADGTVDFDNVTMRALPGNHATQSTSASRPVLSARYNQLSATATLATQSVTTFAATYTLSFSGGGSITLSGTGTGTYSAGSNSVTCTAGTLTLTVSGTVTNADLRVTNDGSGLPSYQRVTTSTDYDTAGFPPYLRFDGVDDALYTGNLSWDSTTMTALAGIRVFGTGSATNAQRIFDRGSPRIWFTDTNTFYHRFVVGYSTTAIAADTAANSAVPPYTHIISANWDGGSARSNVTRKINGSSSSGTTGQDSVGTLSSDANTAFYFGNNSAITRGLYGRIYGLILVGRSCSSAEVSDTERWLNGRTRAY